MKMMVVKVVLSFLILATITVAARARAPAPPPAADFDYLQLVQSWPPSVCIVLPCVITTYPERFLIHGLWVVKSGVSLTNCTGESFTGKAIEGLVPSLMIHWMGLSAPDWRLWPHERNKHGKCTGFAIAKYFDFTLWAYGKHDLTAALKKQNITAGTSSTRENVCNAIRAATGSLPIVNCKEDENKNQVLYSVSLCYNKANALQSCTDRPYRGCHYRKLVQLPKKPIVLQQGNCASELHGQTS